VLVQGVMRLIAFHALRPFHWVWVFSQEWAASLSDVATDPVGDACPCLTQIHHLILPQGKGTLLVFFP